MKQTLRSRNGEIKSHRRIKSLVSKAEGKLKFMRMVTPRQQSQMAENTVYRYMR